EFPAKSPFFRNLLGSEQIVGKREVEACRQNRPPNVQLERNPGSTEIRRAPQDRIGRHHMPLTTGMRLGPYEIVALLGAGGMGAVYRATDTKLNREVAIKVLPEALANDPD